MSKIYYMEKKRAWNKSFWISIFTAMLISVTQFVHYVIPLKNSAKVQYYPSEYPNTSFMAWIGTSPHQLETYLYFMLLPVLVSLPFATSYYEDRKNGYIREICSRTSLKSYLKAKYLAVFLSSGVCFTVPLMINFAMCAAWLPSLQPEAVADNANYITAAAMGYQFFYAHPVLYIVFYLCVDFIFAGLYGCIGISIERYCNHKIVIPLFMVSLFFFIYSFFGMMDRYDWIPSYYLIPGYDNITYLPIVCGICAMCIIHYIAYQREKNRDVY